MADSTCYRLSYLLPGSKEAPLDGQGLQRLPLRLDEVAASGVFRPEHERGASQGCFYGIQTSGREGLKGDGESGDDTQPLAGCRSSLPC